METRWSPESLIRIAWRRKSLVALGLIAGIVASAALGMQLPRVYQSTAQISVVKKRPDAVTGIDTRPFGEENATPPQDFLKSPLIIDRALQSPALAGRTIGGRDDTDIADAIKQGLTVATGRGPTGQTNVYKLTFRTGNADDSRAVLAAVIDSFRDFMDKKHQTVSEDTFELILREKQTLEKEIAQKESAYRSFRATAPILGKSREGLDLRQERLNSIQTKRSNLLLQRVELEGQIAALDRAKKESRGDDAILAMVVEFARKMDSADPGREKSINAQDQLYPLLLEERKLLSLHAAKHPEVLDVRSRIETARRLLILPPSAWRKEGDAAVTVKDAIVLHEQLLKQKLDHMRIAEDLLAGIFQAEQEETRRLAAYEIENDSLQSALSVNQKLYEALVRRLNDISLIRNVGGHQIELLEAPSIGKKVAPSMALVLLVGAFAGLVLGLGLASWSDAHDLRFRTAADVSRSLGLNVLALVPAGRGNHGEAYWKLRNTLCVNVEKNGPKVIQITEPAGHEGASIAAARLVESLAQTGKKVLLIDARSGLWNLAALETAGSATNLVKVHASLTDTDANRLHELLAEMRGQFDFILIDTPAVLASPQASTLAPTIDAAVLSIDLAKTTQSDAERALQLLASAGTKILGVVVHGTNA